MRRYDDIIDAGAMPYSEDLDIEDLALIDSILATLEEDDENEGQRKSITWEIDDFLDGF